MLQKCIRERCFSKETVQKETFANRRCDDLAACRLDGPTRPGSSLGGLNGDIQTVEHVTRVRLVQFQKNTDEPMVSAVLLASYWFSRPPGMIWVGLVEPIVPWTLCLSSEVFTGFFLPGFTDLNLVFFVVCKVVFFIE